MDYGSVAQRQRQQFEGLSSAGSNPTRPTRVKAIYVLVDMAQTGVPVSRRLSPPERESGMLLRPDGGAVERPASRESVPACGLKIASRRLPIVVTGSKADSDSVRPGSNPGSATIPYDDIASLAPTGRAPR